MNFYQTKLTEKRNEALKAVLPILGIVLFLSFTIAPVPPGILLLFLFAALLLVVGMMFFTLGAELSMVPMGERAGTKMAKSMRLEIILFLCFLLGFIITISEPDLQVLAEQVPSVPNQILIIAVASGVGFFLIMAMLRMLFSIRLSALLIFFYGLIFILVLFVPKDFLAVAFDSGGVTTGPMTVPFIMSLGVAASVGIAMFRVLTGISIFWFIVPGYLIAICLSFFVPKIFTAIAFDSGGVASGPMTATFLLPFAMGACQAIGGNIVQDAFGIVAMVAMTPLIAIQLLGAVYQMKSLHAKAIETVSDSYLDAWSENDIIEL